jgi:hypothetical protein
VWGSLEYACTKQGLDAQIVRSMLRNVMEQSDERLIDLE